MYLALDFGTSALKAAIVDAHGQVLEQSRLPWPSALSARPQPEIWWQALEKFFLSLPENYRQQLRALAIAATSGTIVALTAAQTPTASFWYAEALPLHPQIPGFCQQHPDHPAASASSALNKALYLLDEFPDTAALRSQGDWLTGKLLGDYRFGDSHNALKLGFDPESERFFDLPLSPKLLPEVQPPLTFLGSIHETLANTWRLPKNLQIFTGTTDSNAAFMASGAEALGDALTSLGSTLVLKMISDVAIFDGARGIYSHQFFRPAKPNLQQRRNPEQNKGSEGNEKNEKNEKKFLVGGASNVGMAIFNAYFSGEEIKTFSNLTYTQASGLDYYPLLTPGERFPFADAEKLPKLTPRPESQALFFQGISEGIAKVEWQGYQALAAAGAPWPKQVFTVGGGSSNALLTRLRGQYFCLQNSADSEAAVGLARWLARASE